MKRLLPLTISILLFCSATATNPPLLQKKTIPEEAVEIAIADFLKCRLSKKCRVFYMSTYFRGEYDPYEIYD